MLMEIFYRSSMVIWAVIGGLVMSKSISIFVSIEGVEESEEKEG